MRKKRKCSQCGKKGHDKRTCASGVVLETAATGLLIELVNSHLESLDIRLTLNQDRDGRVFIEEMPEFTDMQALAAAKYAVARCPDLWCQEEASDE